jgi:hypothetical protein
MFSFSFSSPINSSIAPSSFDAGAFDGTAPVCDDRAANDADDDVAAVVVVVALFVSGRTNTSDLFVRCSLKKNNKK